MVVSGDDSLPDGISGRAVIQVHCNLLSDQVSNFTVRDETRPLSLTLPLTRSLTVLALALAYLSSGY